MSRSDQTRDRGKNSAALNALRDALALALPDLLTDPMLGDVRDRWAIWDKNGVYGYATYATDAEAQRFAYRMRVQEPYIIARLNPEVLNVSAMEMLSGLAPKPEPDIPNH